MRFVLSFALFALAGMICAQPANDDPCGAVTLTVNVSPTCTNTAGTNATATATAGIPAPGCANYSNRDVWYKLTVPANRAVSIRTTAGGVTDGGMAAYYATACGGTFTLIECDDDDGSGNMPQLDLTCLDPGTIYLRFWRKGAGGGGTFSICATTMTVPAFPVNDDPCGATPLAAGATCGFSAGTTANSCGSPIGVPPTCGNYAGNDVWYVITTASSGTLTVTTTAGSINDGAMAVYTVAGGCSGTFTQIDCDDNAGPGNMPEILLPCQATGTFYVRFWRAGGGTGTFNICATLTATAANDEPCTASALSAGASCGYSAGTTAGACASSSGGTPTCGTYAGFDTWYVITMATAGSLTVTTTANSITDGAMAVYSATGGCAGTFTQLACDDNAGPGNMPEVTVPCLAAGTYYVRFWQAGGGTGTFNICATTLAIPGNDEPCGASSLSAGAACGYVAGTTAGACASSFGGTPSCGNYAGYDTWYVITTASGGSLSVTTTANSITDGAMAIYTAAGGCAGTFTQIACDNNSGPGSMPQINLTCQAAGTYYVRFWQANGGTGTFNICATFNATPANDDPCSATVLAANSSCSYSAATSLAACNTTLPGNPGCGGYNGSDVWFLVTTPAFGALTVTTSAGTISDGAMAVYSATACNGTFTLLDCDDDSGPGAMPQVTLPCRAAGTYYVRVWQFNGGGGTFNICAVFTPTSGAPSNDAPCSAISLSVGTTCAPTNGYNDCATNNATPSSPGCGGFSGASLDVWYSFTAPASGIAILEMTMGTLADPSMALYSGTCGALTLVECDADDGAGAAPSIYRNNLTPGATYFIRIWGTGSTSGTFTICARSPAAPTGFSCSWLIELFDTGGDGWGTSHINVSINGGAATAYTVTEAYNALLIGLNVGQTVSVSYTNTGANQGQNSYRVRLNAATLPYYNSGSPPGSATFNQTVNCMPPSQSQEDCLGAKTLCGSADEDANPSSTGNVADLFGSNYGCLASAERQGLWYVFRMASGGNVGMTLDPAANDDYDWAIWGPYPSTSNTGSICAPSSTPARCSYASGANTVGPTGSYNTGMAHPTYAGSPRWANPSPADSEGASGNGWVKGILTNTGEIYLLYISNFSQSGLAFLLTWQLSNGASLDCTVLPVELLSLSARAQFPAVNVSWATLSEHHSDYYIVERSADAETFQPIGTVEAAGESQQRIDYEYTDAHPLLGANYYRLKQVDLDGAYEHTPSVVVFFGEQTSAPTLFPNPVNDILNVAFDMPNQGTAYLQVLDVNGRVVRDRDMDFEKGPQTANLRVQDLPAGTYNLRLLTTANGGPQNVRFVKE